MICPQHESEATQASLFHAAQNGSLSARSTLVQQHIPLVKFVVKRFLCRGKEYDDLFQTGCVGLLKAIQHFDPSLDTRFSTYAVPLIMGEIRRFLRDDNTLHISRSLHDAAVKIHRCSAIIEQETGENPRIEDICASVGIDKEIALLALGAMTRPRSLSEPVSHGSDTSLSETLPVYSMDGTEDRISLEQAIAVLAPEEQIIVKHRFFDRKTQKEVGDMLNCTQVQISRREKHILGRLRAILGENSTECAIKDQCR